MSIISRFLNIFVGIFVGFFFVENANAGFEWKPAPPVVEQPEMAMPPALPKEEVVIEPFPAQQQKVTKQIDNLDHSSINYEEIMGFGTDIPLVFALRQIVPAEYAFSFDDGVNQAQRVNWTGGKAWNLVLKESLIDVGLDLLIVDHTVWIRPEGMSFFPASEVNEMAKIQNTPQEPAEAMKMVTLKNQSKAEKEVLVKPIAGMSVLKTAEEKAPVIKDYSGANYSPSYPRRKPMNITRNIKEEKESRPVREVKAIPVKTEIKTESNSDNQAVPGYYQDTAKPAPAKDGVKLDPYEISFWQAEKGDSLRETLMLWSDQAGVEMFWGADYDYRLPTAVNMHGTFPDAVKSALTIYETSMNRPLGKLHPNLPEGPSVLVIENEVIATQ